MLLPDSEKERAEGKAQVYQGLYVKLGRLFVW
jgi:hypothetical protein